MANKKSKKPVYPKILNVEFVERLDDGVGHGRFRVRLRNEGEIANLMILDHTNTAHTEWLKKCTEESGGAWPTVLGSSSGEQAWIAFAVSPGRKLSKRLADEEHGLPEIEALNIIMQMAVQLTFAHEQGVAHGALTTDTVMLEPTPGGLDRIQIISWRPSSITSEIEPVRADLMALGQMHYQLLTGVLPPSAQTAASDLEGDSAGAFDDVLMDWIDEDRDLQGLGRPAVEALAETSRFETVSAFVEALQPHFAAHLTKTIEETGEALESDRSFMVEVETQRLRLKELESRQRFIRDWLFERVERIEQCEDELDTHRNRLRSLETLQTQVDLSIGRSRVGENQAIKSVLSAWQPDEEIDPIDIEEGVLSVAPPLIPPETLNPVATEDDEAEDMEAVSFHVEPSASTQPGFKLGFASSMFMVLILVSLGGLGAAWILNTSGEPFISMKRAPEKLSKTRLGSASQRKPDGTMEGASPPPTRQKSKAQLEPKITAAPARHNTRADETQKDLGQRTPEEAKTTSATSDATTDAQVTKDARTIEKAALKVDAATAATTADAGSPPTFTGVALGKAPDGMVAIQGGELWLGLDAPGAEILIKLCKEERLRVGATGCEIITAEISEKTKSIPSFFLDQFEVSQDEYNRCRKAKVCRQYGPNWKIGPSPATGINQKQAAAYCRWAGKRLPTFEEWLYATRGPDSRRVFPWGNLPLKSDSGYRANLGRFRRKGGAPFRGDGHKYVAPVTAFKDVQTPFMVTNLVGNVREWTSTEKDGRFRLAGGSWQSAAHRLRVTREDFVAATIFPDDVGVRCAQSAKVSK